MNTHLRVEQNYHQPQETSERDSKAMNFQVKTILAVPKQTIDLVSKYQSNESKHHLSIRPQINLNYSKNVQNLSSISSSHIPRVLNSETPSPINNIPRITPSYRIVGDGQKYSFLNKTSPVITKNEESPKESELKVIPNRQVLKKPEENKEKSLDNPEKKIERSSSNEVKIESEEEVIEEGDIVEKLMKKHENLVKQIMNKNNHLASQFSYDAIKKKLHQNIENKKGSDLPKKMADIKKVPKPQTVEKSQSKAKKVVDKEDTILQHQNLPPQILNNLQNVSIVNSNFYFPVVNMKD